MLGFLGLLLFTVGFTFGFGALVWVYAGESFPARLRSLGASAMLTADLVANVAVAAVFLTLLTRVGGAGTFVVFGLLAVAAFVFVFKLAPETKGRPLDDIRHYWENGGTWPADSAAETSDATVAEAARTWTPRSDHGRLPARARHRRLEDPGGARPGRCVIADVRGPQRQPRLGRPRRCGPPAARPARRSVRRRHRPGRDLVRLRRRRRGRHPRAARPGSPRCSPSCSPAPASPSCTTPSCCSPPPGTPTGIAVIAGTGSVAWGRDPGRSPGPGRRLGLPAGRRGQRLRHRPRRGPARRSTGSTPVWDPTGCPATSPPPAGSATRTCCSISSTPMRERRYWAERSRTVFELAEAGDPAAYGIVADAGRGAGRPGRTGLAAPGASPGRWSWPAACWSISRSSAGCWRDRLAGIGVTDVRLLDAARLSAPSGWPRLAYRFLSEPDPSRQLPHTSTPEENHRHDRSPEP